MQPSALTAASFAGYPPLARAVAQAHVALLLQLPLAFLPSLLRELIEYDFKFPVERTELDRQMAYLSARTPLQLAGLFSAFTQIHLSPDLEAMDWCGRPVDFTEQLSAFLWRSHQMPAFRAGAAAYGDRLQQELPQGPLPVRRLGIAVIGHGAVRQDGTSLFTKLRAHGTCFSNVDPQGGLQALLAAVEERARRSPAPYAHWYVDGGAAQAHSAQVTGVSWAALQPARAALLDRIGKETSKAGMGPEELRDHLMHLAPADLGMASDPVLDHFQLKVLTEGSGTQIFSTTFAQWTAREALRRAEPWTLLVRFQPRQRERPMNELLANHPTPLELDAQGSLIDADMSAYYQWIDQQRLSGAAESAFLVWFEDQRQAVAIGPGLPRGAESNSRLTLSAVLALATG